MGTELKVRLLRIDKKQKNLLDELQKRGFKTLTKCSFSNYINGKTVSKRGNEILRQCDEIVTGWEQEIKEGV